MQTKSTIRKVGNEYVIYSKEGKRLGKESSLEAAKKRLQQIEYFKHKGKSNMTGTIAGISTDLVIDNKDHFPIDTPQQAQNAVLRATRLYDSPNWFNSDVKALKQIILQAIAVKYPDLRVSIQTSAQAAIILGKEIKSVPVKAEKNVVKVDLTLANNLIEQIKKRQEELDKAMKLANRLVSQGLSGEEFTKIVDYIQHDVLHELMRNGVTASREQALEKMVKANGK